MHTRIISIDLMDDGVLVTFAKGVVSFFEAAFLYEQLDKRVETPTPDTPGNRSPSDL